MSNENDLQRRFNFLINKINKTIEERNNLIENRNLTDTLFRILNHLNEIENYIETNREIKTLEIETKEDEGVLLNEERLNNWWTSEEKYFFHGKFKIMFSKYGIERVIRIANIDGKKDNTIILEDENINAIETFNQPECVLCLDKKPNILFCNCGHQCICVTCNNIYEDSKCPVCKIENSIKRKINN